MPNMEESGDSQESYDWPVWVSSSDSMWLKDGDKEDLSWYILYTYPNGRH